MRHSACLKPIECLKMTRLDDELREIDHEQQMVIYQPQGIVSYQSAPTTGKDSRTKLKHFARLLALGYLEAQQQQQVSNLSIELA